MRTTTLTTLACAIALCGASVAQSNPIRYPHAGTNGSAGQIVPLGILPGSTNFDEGRWQQLIPARYLPSSGGLILGLEVLSQATLAVTYTDLKITMSLVPSGHQLSTNCATNLPQPFPVFGHQGYTVNWTAQQWQTIPLDSPFVYDGMSDLVVDIRKVIDRSVSPPTGLAHHQTDGDVARRDLQVSRYQFGAFGSGAANTATTSYTTSVLKMGFQFAGLPTMTLGSQLGGANGHVFAINGQFTSSLHGTPGMPFGALIGLAWFAAPVPVPGLSGAIWIDPTLAVSYASGNIGASGVETSSWSVPNNPSLVGGRLVFQGVSVATSGLVLTNGVDCLINN